MTFDSVISRIRSLPSRVRSPTPAKTDVPPKLRATRMIISWMSTVLPTPAPPNRPILPPLTYGASRSSTLMPVSSISVLGSRSAKAGAWRWISHRSLTSRRSPSLRFRHSPMALKTWPLVMSPTGTEMALPVSRTSAPRTRPSVGCMEMARTMLSPRCWATSRVRVLVPSASETSTCNALKMSGMASRGNSASTTGPMTRTTRPAAVVSGRLGVSTVVISGFTSRCGERVRAADGFTDLLRDRGLPRGVHLPGQILDHFFRVVGRALHGPTPGRRLARRRVDQRGVDARVDVLGQQRVEQRLRIRLELVRRQRALVLGLGLLDVHRRQEVRDRRLRHQRAELRVHDVQFVHAGSQVSPDTVHIVRSGDERLDEATADLARVGERG